MGKTILVTGATGNIGWYVVSELTARGEDVRVAVRDTGKSQEEFSGLNVELAAFDFLNPDLFESALEGVEKMFLIRPPQLAQPKKDMAPFIQKAKEMGVRQVVFVSLMGVEKNPVVPHRKIEDLLRASGIGWTFLRPGFFMQNLNTAHREDIALRNELYMPAGQAKTSFIDTRDIAAVAAVCLTEEGHAGQAYTLTGAEALDYREAAQILSEILGREIIYQNPGVLEFRKTLIKRGTKKEFANVMTMLYVFTKLGTAEKVTGEIKRLLNREPITFRQYAIDFQDSWK